MTFSSSLMRPLQDLMKIMILKGLFFIPGQGSVIMIRALASGWSDPDVASG